MLSMKSRRVSDSPEPGWTPPNEAELGKESVPRHALDELVHALGRALARQSGQSGPDRQG